MKNIINQLAKARLVPVIVIKDAAKAVPLAQALYDGGLPCAEVTLRTPDAIEAIRAIAQALPEMLLGAGTVLTTAQADAAKAAGAKYMVAPGLNPDVVKHCLSIEMPTIPGVCTPSEVELGLSLGLDALKFFPAEAAGGVGMLKSLAGPYGGVKFLPTGGISHTNLHDYLALKSVFACGGSWMVKDELIDAEDFAQITELTRAAVELANAV